MYGNVGAGTVQRGDSPLNPAQIRPTVANTHVEAIAKLIENSRSLESLLSKVSGAQPEENMKEPEDMPSVMSHAGKIHLLACQIGRQLKELHEIIGE